MSNLRIGCAVLLAAAVPCQAEGQAVEGRVLDEEDDRPVPTALVRLVDENGDEVGLTTADSAGRYRVEADEPGVFRLRAERIGYEPMETPLLEMGRPDGVYPLDLLVRRAPALTRKTFDLVPLDMLHTIVLVGPHESVTYPGGAVLMYTEAWVR